jgi:uncharacterized membrane protein YeiH
MTALRLYIDLSATFLFATTGAMFALRRGYDWAGIFVLALCSGLGGGLLRDSLFIQDGAPAAMRTASYLWAVVAGCVATVLFHRFAQRMEKAFLIADALGLGAYGVVGTSKAYAAGLSPLASIFVGVVNAVGGSLIRDVLVRAEPLVFKPGQFYALTALLGCCTYVLLTIWLAVPAPTPALAAIAITFVARMLSIRFNWRTAPILPEPHEAAIDRKRD